MKILAMERETPGVSWDDLEEILKLEAQEVFQLYLSDVLREIYFTENNTAILVLETQDKGKAKTILDNLPLVRSGKIQFDLVELRPYRGFRRLFSI